MGAGDGQAALEAGHLRQQPGPVDLPPAAFATGESLGVVGGDGGGEDDLCAGRHVLGAVSDRGLQAGRAQAVQVGRLGPVAAGHLGAQRVGDQRQAAHPRPADAGEVQAAPREVRGAAHLDACPRAREVELGSSPAAASTWVATARAAPGRASVADA